MRIFFTGIIITLACFTLVTPAMAGDTVRVTDFGARPNSFVDAAPAFKKAVDACREKSGVVLFIGAGRFDIYPGHAAKKEVYASNTSSASEVPDKTKTFGLLFENLQGLTIDGGGALLVFHGKMSPWAFINCSDIDFRNVSVDFERPTMSEMTIEKISANEVVAKVHPDSKFEITDGRLYWYGEGWTMRHYHAILANPATGINTYSSWEPFSSSRSQLLAPGLVRFKGDFSAFNASNGDVLTVRETHRDQLGGFINLSRNIRLENIRMHYMHGFGILAQFSENLSYDSLIIAPRKNSGRVMAGFADALHFSGCKGQVTISNSYFSGLHDDPVNVHGTHLKITEIQSANRLKLRFMHPQSYGFPAFFAGDSVAFVHSESLQVFGVAQVSGATLVTPYEMVVELTRPLPKGVAAGDCLENISWSPSVTVKGNRFEKVNTRGLLVTARGKVLIEGNHFYRTGMAAILIANDASGWYESGPVQDVEIRDNIFEECGYNSKPDNYAISIFPETHRPASNYFVHRNIRIVNNTFILDDRPLLRVRSTDGLTFRGNTIRGTIAPGVIRVDRPSFHIDRCRRVTILGNTFPQQWAPKIALINTPAQGLNTDLR